MYGIYQDRERLEDDLYQEEEGDSEGSDANSELEFHLYSQLHYSSNPGELEEQEEQEDGEAQEHEGEDTQQNNVIEKITDGDGGLVHTTEIKPLTPTNGSLQQHPKKKREKQDKLKKKKSDPKGQRSPSSLFEEVIVIDSSPEVISISDDDTVEDNEGICALKGRGMQTSTPAQQVAQKRKRTPGVLVTVESSSSETDSDESTSQSDSSDSDCLESWMILGQGKQDGDHSISLNLEGGSDTESDAEEGDETWLVSDKDKEAQIYNKRKGVRLAVQRVSNRYYTDKNVRCRNCSKTGHLSKNCPEPKKLSPCLLCGTPGHPVRDCPNRHCNNCGLPGHLYDSCSEKAYWYKQCHRCSMTGHFFDACPEIWRQYHMTTKSGLPIKQQPKDSNQSLAYCYNCSRKGHFGHACTQRRMFNGVYPTTSLINHYDTVEDINRRKHRMKIKVKELKKNGYLPSSAETLLTPGPPKKKRKIIHLKNNHQSNHTPHHTPSNHNPRPNHLVFSDNNFSAATPKTKKFNKYKQQESVGNVKPWKPKRPVPTSRDPLPAAKPILDGVEDFPRGGGTGENRKMRRKRNKMKHVALAQPGGHTEKRKDQLFGSVGGKMQGPKSKQQHKREKKKKRKNQAPGTADKKTGSEMYPADDNLFFIKQRKRSR